MMGKAHTAVLERAARAAGGRYGELLLRERHWLEKRAAGRFNDSVLRDWHYKKVPQTVWCVRRLTRAILEAGESKVPAAEDESRTAFLLHWVSHYFVDAIWTCHVAQRYMEGASALEQKEFDNGIEYEVEEIVETHPAFEAPALEGRGYWALFWRGRLESDRRSRALLEAWGRKEGYLAISLESVPYCVGSFAAYLAYLNALHDGARVGGAHPDNAWVVALHEALEGGHEVREGEGGRTGPETDAWLDETGAAFGTGEPRLERWPGEWVLSLPWSGAQLAERVFTPEFAAEIRRMRGYDRSIEQDQAAGEPPSAEAIADRDRQVAIMYDWLKRWDVAIGNVR